MTALGRVEADGDEPLAIRQRLVERSLRFVLAQMAQEAEDQLRLEMLNKINQYMDRKIEAIYITDMIIE